MKRQQQTEGAFIKIPINEEFFTYGRILADRRYAFYDCKTNKEIKDLSYIASKPILFIIYVYKQAVTQGHWLKIGKLPLEDKLKSNPPLFMWNEFEPEKWRIYKDGKTYIVNKQACQGLERFAIWEHYHVEERLRNHYEGVPNIYVEEDKKNLE